MKKLILLLIAFPLLLVAQEKDEKSVDYFEKGKNMIGLNGGFGQSFLSTDIRYGKFIFNKTVVGIDFGTMVNWNVNGFGADVGPFIRYNFLDRKFSPLIEANYKMGYYRFGPYNAVDQVKTSFSEGSVSQLQTGFQWVFLKGLGIDVLVGGRFQNSKTFNFPEREFNSFKNASLSGQMRLTFNF